jgi:CRISPR system Cascade subunit CasD
MTERNTLLFRLIGPMQAWGYRSRFEDRDTGPEPTRSGVLGLLAAARGVAREDKETLALWDNSLRFGVRADVPALDYRNAERSGFRVETDFHTAQNVLRAAGKGFAETVLSRRHYLADARFTVGLESSDLALLTGMEQALKNPTWTLCLGRKSFPLAVPPWLPRGGMRAATPLLEALKLAPFPLLSSAERLPADAAFSTEPDPGLVEAPEESVPMRLADRPFDFASDARRFGLRDVARFRLKTADCGMEADRCLFLK